MTKVVINCCFGGYSLSKEAYEFLGLEWDEFGFEFEDDRTNPKLVECVETLKEKANGGNDKGTQEQVNAEWLHSRNKGS